MPKNTKDQDLFLSESLVGDEPVNDNVDGDVQAPEVNLPEDEVEEEVSGDKVVGLEDAGGNPPNKLDTAEVKVVELPKPGEVVDVRRVYSQEDVDVQTGGELFSSEGADEDPPFEWLFTQDRAANISDTGNPAYTPLEVQVRNR